MYSVAHKLFKIIFKSALTLIDSAVWAKFYTDTEQTMSSPSKINQYHFKFGAQVCAVMCMLFFTNIYLRIACSEF